MAFHVTVTVSWFCNRMAWHVTVTVSCWLLRLQLFAALQLLRQESDACRLLL
jgi:hypothetical protein